MPIARLQARAVGIGRILSLASKLQIRGGHLASIVLGIFWLNINSTKQTGGKLAGGTSVCTDGCASAVQQERTFGTSVERVAGGLARVYQAAGICSHE